MEVRAASGHEDPQLPHLADCAAEVLLGECRRGLRKQTLQSKKLPGGMGCLS